MEPWSAPEDDDDSIATVLKEVIANDVRSQAANVFATILETVEEAVKQLLGAANFSASKRIRTRVGNTVDHVIIDQLGWLWLAGRL